MAANRREDIQRKEQFMIEVDGELILVDEGQTVAAALLRRGIKTLRFTKKRLSSRGVFCGIGLCNDCLMIVNGIPNVRTCVTRVEKGMKVTTQKGLGSLALLELEG